VSAVDTSRPDTIARRPRFRTHRGHGRSLHRAAAARRAADTLVWTAAHVEVVPPPWTPSGGWPPLPSPAGRAWTVGRRRPPCPCLAQGSRGHVRGRARPSGQHLAAIPDVQRTLPRYPVPWTPPGFRARSGAASSHRRPKLRQRTRPVDTSNRQAAGIVDTRAAAAGACGHCGSGRLDSRQRNRPMLPHVRPGTGAQRAVSASTAMARPPDP
jgi:hypothetical protein